MLTLMKVTLQHCVQKVCGTVDHAAACQCKKLLQKKAWQNLNTEVNA